MTVHTTGTREEWLAVGERATARTLAEGSVRRCHASLRQLGLTAVREGPGQLVLREIEDRGLGVLFEHWTDPTQSGWPHSPRRIRMIGPPSSDGGRG